MLDATMTSGRLPAMMSLLNKLSRHLLIALLLVNLLAPVQKVFACAPMAAIPMTMDCCTTPAKLDGEAAIQVEQAILHGDSCCVIELQSSSQLVAPQPLQADTLLPAAEPLWQPVALVLPEAMTPFFAPSVFTPPVNEPVPSWGRLTYARTARLRI